MKTIKRILLFFLLTIVLTMLAACGEGSADPIHTEAPAAESVTLAEKGASDYVVVCDTKDGVILRLVNDFVAAVRSKLGVTWPVKDAAEGPFEHEIVIGNVRDGAASVAALLEERSDFAISLEKDDLVICASDSRYYAYALSYVEYEWVKNAKNKTLSVSPADAIHRAASELSDVPFLTYWRRYNFKIGSVGLKYFMDETDVVLGNGSVMKSYVYIPYEYDPEKAYPVLIHLHGADAIGNAGNHLASLNGAFNAKDSPLTEAIVIAPQCPVGNRWVEIDWSLGTYSTDTVPESFALKGVMSILAEIEETYNTDKSRYYVRGYSMGGYGTWDLLARYPGKFAAALPICGGGDPTKAEGMLDVAIRTFHGEVDSLVPVTGTRALVAAIEAVGGTKLAYTELAGAGHGIWNEILDSGDHLAWMFAQQRTENE